MPNKDDKMTTYNNPEYGKSPIMEWIETELNKKPSERILPWMEEPGSGKHVPIYEK